MRNLGISMPHLRATLGEGHKLGSSDCLTKTQTSAKSYRRRIGVDACPVLEG